MTTEKELQDAIKRMERKPEARGASANSKSWWNFLMGVVGIDPDRIQTRDARDFWENVRIVVNEHEMERTGQKPEPEPEKPQERKPIPKITRSRSTFKSDTGRDIFMEVSTRTQQVSYRDKITGRYTTRNK